MNLRERCALVVPTLRAGPTLAAALESFGAGWRARAIVVDNRASGAGIDGVCDRFPDVAVIRMGANRGFAAAVNAGIHAARQRGDEVVLLVNDDVLVDASSLDVLAQALQSEPQIASAAGVLMQAGSELIDTAGLRCDPAIGTEDVARHRRLSELSEQPAPLGPSGGLGAYRLAALAEVGDFDEGFFAYYEDADVALRLALNGWRCVLAPDAVGQHRGSETLGWRSLEKAVIAGRSRGRIARRYGVHRHPGAWPWLGLELAAGLLLCAEHRSLAPLRARCAGFREATQISRYPSELIEATSARRAVVERVTRRYRKLAPPALE
ncbi:MAG TPA: glycosyltransferase [Solirubrobacteraceae bacterium]|nr:glycosyltransferase [Solirubrobacteraceae bacterium]